MNNIQKSFKRKSELRGMADGGSVHREIDPAVLGTGGAARAGHQIRAHNRNTAAEIDSLFEPAATPAPQPAPAKKPEEKSALRSFFGLADGGQVFKNTVGGVPTYTDARAATAGATAHTPGSGGGTFSVIGMEPAQKQQMANAAAQRQAAANAPTTLGGRLDAALGKLNSPAASAGAPSSTPTLGSELDAAIGRTQGVTSAQTPATGAPANTTSGFTPQERQTFNSMSQTSAAGAAQMRDIGVRAGEAAAAAARPASPLQSSSFDEPSFELEFADGGKVKGKGGPTDDKVGPVMLSNGEYVLPADTVEIVGRDKLDALRLATHDFVDEDNKPKVSGLRKMANAGPVFADPALEARRQLQNEMLGQPPQTAAGSSGGGGRGLVPHQPTATGSPGGGGRGLVPTRPPSTAMVPYEPPVTKLSPTETPRPQAGGLPGGGGTLRSLLGRASLVGNAVAAAPAVNASAGEWARGIPGVLRGESAPQPNTKVRFLGEQPATAGTPEPVFNPTVEELDRRGALRPESVDAAMGNLRAGNAPGGGFQQIPGTDVFRRNNPNAGNPGESARQYVGVGTPERQTEDPIMGELRSALRGLTDGAGNRGGGGGYMSALQAREINKRYDDMLRDGSGRNRVRGLDWSQRHGLDVERARASELGEFARNQSALRGQDMRAAASADSNRTAALQAVAGMMERQQKADADAQAAGLRAQTDAAKAQTDAAKASEGRSKDAMASMNDAIDRFAAGDKGVAADLARVASTVPADLRAAIDSLPASDRPGAWASVFDAYGAQSRGFVGGRDAGATVQNTLLGAGVGASMPGIGRGVGYVGDLAGTLLTKGRYRGTVLRDLLGSRAGSAALGAGAGAFATKKTQTTGRLDMPMVGEDGLPTQADATFVEGLQHGFYDTNKPWAKLQRGESGKLQANDYTDDELAAIRDLTSLRRFGRE